jgi:hypothetical protein
MTPRAIPADRASRHARKLRVRRIIVVAIAAVLTIWLASAAQSPASGPIERVLLLAIALLVPLHVVAFQLDGYRILDRKGIPRRLRGALAVLMLCASPMVLYPLGLIALLVSLFSGGGAAAPALAVSGLVLLSPIILLLAIALMFALHGYKGG